MYTNNKQNDAKQTIHTTTQKLGRVLTVPRLCGFYPGICLTTEENHGKTSVRVAILWRLDNFSSWHSLNICRMVKTRTVWLVGHVASMEGKINDRNYSHSSWETWSNEAALWYGWEDNTEIDVMKYVWLLWTGFMRSRLGRGGGLLWTRLCIFGFYEQAWNFLAS